MEEYFSDLASKYAEVDDLINDDVILSYFRRVITHESQDKIENYEELEYLGDRRLKSSINSYLFIEFETIDNKQSVFSTMQAYLDSDIFLSKLAKSIGLDKWCTVDDPTVDIDKVHEDMFEAWIGAMFMALKRYGGVEFAAGKIETVIHKILYEEGVTLDMRNEIKMFKDTLNQVLKKSGINLEPKYKEIDKTNNITISSVSIRVGKNNIELGVGSGKNKLESRNNAAKDAVENLNKSKLNKIKNQLY